MVCANCLLHSAVNRTRPYDRQAALPSPSCSVNKLYHTMTMIQSVLRLIVDNIKSVNAGCLRDHRWLNCTGIALGPSLQAEVLAMQRESEREDGQVQNSDDICIVQGLYVCIHQEK